LNEETLRLLEEADWRVIQTELLTYTTWRAGNYWWRRGDGLELAQGTTVEDVTQEVMIKALTGVRRWDPTRGELLPWLQAQVNSILDALAKSAPHRHEVDLLEAEILAVIHPSDLLALVLDEEGKTETKQKVNALLRIVDSEPELREILEIILDGCEPKPRHIAIELGVPVEHINNRLKRLRRRAQSPLLVKQQ
jgi:RNA polymerase sigma factor (sigma-70 family)